MVDEPSRELVRVHDHGRISPLDDLVLGVTELASVEAEAAHLALVIAEHRAVLISSEPLRSVDHEHADALRHDYSPPSPPLSSPPPGGSMRFAKSGESSVFMIVFTSVVSHFFQGAMSAVDGSFDGSMRSTVFFSPTWADLSLRIFFGSATVVVSASSTVALTPTPGCVSRSRP